MKNLKRIVKIAGALLSALFLYANMDATTISVSNGGTYYVCCGSTNTFAVTPGYLRWVSNDTNWHWGNVYNTCLASNEPCTFGGYTINSYTTQNTTDCSGYNSYNEVSITAPNYVTALLVSVLVHDCGSFTSNPTWINFTIVPYSTTISGTQAFCDNVSSETYTCTSNVPGSSLYSWTDPSFMTGSSTTYTISVTPTNTVTATGNISVTVNGSLGCPSGNPSNTGSLSLTSYSNPGTPGGTLVYQEYNNTCYYNANIPAVSGAQYYEWGKNSSFTSLWCANTTGPTTTGGPFYENTSYTIYVRVTNPCGTGTYTSYTKTTPMKAGCIQIHHGDEKPPGESSSIEYKVYPNPANSELTIEYPTPEDNSGLNLSVYDMLGHMVMCKALPATENIATENISGIASGLYVYVIISRNDIVQRGKLMVQR